MKRRKIFLYNSIISVLSFIGLTFVQQSDGAIIPPPWSDPEKNPCASMPGGWQLLYWLPLKKCFKIFNVGYPCPETMELSPTAFIGSSKKKIMTNGPIAECRCPPGTALSALNNKCFKIYERGPCNKGQYFSPVADMQTNNKRTSNRWGVCKTPRICPENMLYWPMDGKCYTRLSKGPCSKGKLLLLNDEDLAECKCENKGQLTPYYYDVEGSCHEHFTKGPCDTPGQIFLPGGICDCHRFLPHYHEEHQMCYELNTPGPCAPGHIFRLPENSNAIEDVFSRTALKAQCQCKDGYVPWSDGLCYRLYTQGPCEPDEFLINATSCAHNFCGKNRLFFPDQNRCYRIGTQGPCDLHQVVVFDFTNRPSLDGISYNGMCGCAGIITNLDQQCITPNESSNVSSSCESTPGMVELEGNCFKLYTRGPCGPGQWLETVKSIGVDSPRLIQAKAKCVCRPGYTAVERENNATSSVIKIQSCNAPTVGLARYLMQHTLSRRQNSKSPTHIVK